MSPPRIEHVRLGFVCVQNAGRSQMATAFAERERARRGLTDRVEVVTGGTHPAEAVHSEVVDAMRELDVDLGGREPRGITAAELNRCDVVATMGCSTLELDADVELRDWALDDPHGRDPDRVREIRDEVERRVVALFDELFGESSRVGDRVTGEVTLLPARRGASPMQWKLFADLAEVADGRTVDVAVGPGDTVGDALDALLEAQPALRERVLTADGELQDHINLLRNGRNVAHEDGLDTELEAGDELALFPPVSGG